MLNALLDEGTFEPMMERDDSGIYTARGLINGSPVIAYASDPLKMGGAMGSAGCVHIVEAIDAALRDRVPVLGIWHSGGARLAEGVEALHAVGSCSRR